MKTFYFSDQQKKKGVITTSPSSECMQVLTWLSWRSCPDGISDSARTEKVQLLKYKGREDTPWRLVGSISVDTPAGGFPAMLQPPVRKQWLALYRNKTRRRPKTKARETSIIRFTREEGSFVYLSFRRGQGDNLTCSTLTHLNDPFTLKLGGEGISVRLFLTPERWRNPEQHGLRPPK